MLPLLALAALAPSAPVPKPGPPNPLGCAYVGVRVTGDGTAGGMTIDPPDPDTPAAHAGLKEGDVLVGIGRLEKVESFEQFAEYVLDLRPGSGVRLTVKRGGELKQFWVVLGERPESYGPPTYPRRSRYSTLPTPPR